ncbi:MAG: SUMF1/EgtB/PvdO family nonheme iron enzyme [Thermoguttaceae bacterium]|nr:SUMF1/EgtB/PvdO family nonheme iron enzyme [Thermoguttaceae bacterium]
MSEPKIKKQALLIGINEYQILPELKYARQDAEAVEQALKQNYCFSDDEVMLLTDAKPGLFKPSNRRIIEKHLEKLASQDLDLFIFGFWGHGLFRNGQRYFCPLDAISEDIEELGLSFDSLQRLLSNIKAKNTCLILDCCQKVHDRGEEETLTADDQTVMENAARDIVLKRKEKEPEFVSNVAILNSCKQGQAAYEWDSRKHGIFTAHLLDAMNRRFDSVAQIVGYISKNVEKTAMELGKTQTPFYKLEGDILLPVDTKSTPLVTGNVFISYRHCNADLVAPVEEELKKRGISYFIDRVGVNYGMEYSEALTQALKASKVLLFFWTKNASGSTDLFREVKMALDLKKRVIPYKIGTFNVIEHDSLYYQLSPLSRYEVSAQTPETVKEIVNRVEQALKGKTYQQYSFTLPEKSQDAVIQKPEIEDINVTFTPELIEPNQPIQGKGIQLPPLPEDLLKIQAENRGLRTAIEQLKSFTHESLAQANSAVAQAQAQFDAWSERKERLWKGLPELTRLSLEKTIEANPECTEKDVKIPTGDMSYQQYFDFLEQIQCGKKYELAKQELERVEWERKNKCNEAIAKFQKKIEGNNDRFKDSSRNFLDEAVKTILSAMPGYDNVSAPFPEDSILAPMRLLEKYELGWRPDRSMDRARKLWAEKRPCVIKARTEKQQQAKRELEIEIEKENRRRKWILGAIAGAVGLVVLLIFSCIYSVEKAREQRQEEKQRAEQAEAEKIQKQFESLLSPGQTAGERKVVTVNGVEFAFRWCPAGTFMMGSPTSEEGRYYDEERQHEVTLTKGFWMMETEVTQKQWKAVMGNNPSHFQGDDLPVEQVSWSDCQEFCRKTGLQLPTEAQWEYACRAGSTTAYFWGNALNGDKANCSGNFPCGTTTQGKYLEKTTSVGSYQPNAWGLYDMHGNVWEWCQDWYAVYPSGSVTDPVVSSSGSYRVYRGGSWNYDARNCRSAFRNFHAPGSRNDFLGFRVVRGQ